MDRGKVCSLPALGLVSLVMASGCQSFSRRATVPPAPKTSRDGGPVGFNSAPPPVQSAANGRGLPTGPTGSTNSPYGSSGLYGRGPSSREADNATLGGRAPAAGNAATMSPPGDAPPAF